MLGLKHGFEKACPQLHGVDCVIAGKMPDVYRCLPGIRDIKNVETADDLLEEYDLAISVDCGSADRLGEAQPYFARAKTSVNIDHHISNKRFGKINVVVPSASASGEIIADIFQEMKLPLDPNIATCLYAALITDTGCFKYSNTTPKALELAARLVNAGADPEYLYKQLFENHSRAQIMLHADATLRAKFNQDYTLAWTIITRDLLAAHTALDEHIDGLVEALRQIDTVVISAMFKETLDGKTKVSLRSDLHAIDVAAIMEQFGGGGHKMAAGCTMAQPPEQAAEILLPLLEQKIREKALFR